MNWNAFVRLTTSKANPQLTKLRTAECCKKMNGQYDDVRINCRQKRLLVAFDNSNIIWLSASLWSHENMSKICQTVPHEILSHTSRVWSALVQLS